MLMILVIDGGLRMKIRGVFVVDDGEAFSIDLTIAHRPPDFGTSKRVLMIEGGDRRVFGMWVVGQEVATSTETVRAARWRRDLRGGLTSRVDAVLESGGPSAVPPWRLVQLSVEW
jgi:hypothetical protein